MTAKLILKYLLSAGIIVLVSETVKRSDKAGALLAALPFVSIITLFWVYYESDPAVRDQKRAITCGTSSGMCCRRCRCSCFSPRCSAGGAFMEPWAVLRC